MSMLSRETLWNHPPAHWHWKMTLDSLSQWVQNVSHFELMIHVLLPALAIAVGSAMAYYYFAIEPESFKFKVFGLLEAVFQQLKPSLKYLPVYQKSIG